jgi:signal transduction histidine kinase
VRNTLFLKVYLTLLASLAVVALVSGLFFHFSQDEESMGWSDRRDHFLAALLPPADEPEFLQSIVDRLAAAANGDIAVYSADGRLLAAAGNPLPDPGQRPHRIDSGARTFGTNLPDGRRIAARVNIPFAPGNRNPLIFVALIAAAIGVAAYPIVRHLTRRLETLRKAVETWGSGDLTMRVAVDGKDEVTAVARSFNKAADEIEKLIAAHRDLLANASHELRSPLARLRMAVDLYEQEPRQQTREEIVRNLVEVDSLVEEILLASRLDHLDKLAGLQSVDLLAVVAEEGARNSVDVSGEQVVIWGDPKLLQRMVRNLMQNAFRHGAPPVSARVERVDGGARLRVTDHGPGLPEDEGTRVFEPFYRPAGRSEAGGGWGIGLSLVRQIAELHGAKVGYESPPAGGACFCVVFPRAADAGSNFESSSLR